jgi:hypothetical protein
MEKQILIKQTKLPTKVFREDKYFEKTENWYIDNPLSGLITEKFWNEIKRFQELCYVDDQFKNIDDIEKWKQLQKESKSFYNTIVEFNVQISNEEYRRSFCELGKKLWKEV